MKKNGDEGYRSTPCTSAFRNCPAITDLRLKETLDAPNPLIVAGTEDKWNFQPIFYDVKSFRNKVLKAIIVDNMKLDADEISDQETGQRLVIKKNIFMVNILR